MGLPPIAEDDTLEAALPSRPLSRDVLEGSKIKTATDYGDDSEPNTADDEYARSYTSMQARKASQVKGVGMASSGDDVSPTSSTTSSSFVCDTTAGMEPLYGDDGEEDSYFASY